MTSAPLTLAARIRIRVTVVMGLAVILMLTGTGVATARWIIAATTTLSVTAGELTTGVAGTAGLGAVDIDTDEYTAPVALILDTPSPVSVDYTLQFDTWSGTLDPAEIALTVWEPTGDTCPATVPDADTGTRIGSLATPPLLPTSGAVDEPKTVVCAATRFTGALSESAGHSLTTTPILTARLITGTWTATARGDDVTHIISSDLTGDLVGNPAESPTRDLSPDFPGDPAGDPVEDLTGDLPEALTENPTGDLADDSTEDPAENPAAGLVPVSNLVCADQDELSGLADGGIELTWDPVSGATGYRILASTGRALEVTAPTVELATYHLGRATWIDVQALSPTEQSPPIRHEVHVDVSDDLEETLRCN